MLKTPLNLTQISSSLNFWLKDIQKPKPLHFIHKCMYTFYVRKDLDSAGAVGGVLFKMNYYKTELLQIINTCLLGK